MSILSKVGIGISIVTVMAVYGDGLVTEGGAVSSSSGILDYANAIPMENLIESGQIPSTKGGVVSLGKPGVANTGRKGSGEKLLEKVPSSKNLSSSLEVAPSEYGTSNHPFTTTRVDMYNQRLSRKYPNRVSGKLFFNNAGSTYVCSASSIEKGVVVTAAHCVSDFGTSTFYTDFEFIPAYYYDTSLSVAKAPYGRYGAIAPVAMTSYIDGTDNCTVAGVVCENDVAVLIMKRRPNPDTGTDQFPGERTGTYTYGYNGYGFSTYDGKQAAQITKMGYPVSHDSGWKMQRSDSLAFTDATNSNNSVMGSRQTGGASGGPWIVNYGEVASLTTTLGSEAVSNAVVGTTSWGYTSADPKQQGASPFTDTNIVILMDYACTNYPANCW